MKSPKSNRPSTPSRRKARVDPMTISALIDAQSELTDSTSSKSAIVLMTRVRLARNPACYAFPGSAKCAQREQILEVCRAAITGTAQMKRAYDLSVGELSDLEKQILVERHLISRELSGSKGGAGVVISK